VEKRTQKWTADRCVQALERFIEEKGRRPYAPEMRASEGLPSQVAFQNAVGLSCKKYCDAHGYPGLPARGPRWDADSCKDALRRFVEENGRLPDLSREAQEAFGLPTPYVFNARIGIPMGRYMRENYPDMSKPVKRIRPQWSREQIDAAAKRFFDTHGRYPRSEEYDLAHGLPSHNTFRSHFGINAGTYWKERFPMDPEWTPEKVRKMLEDFIEAHDRLPNTTELNAANGLPSMDTLLRYTGAASYSDYCRETYPGEVYPLPPPP